MAEGGSGAPERATPAESRLAVRRRQDSSVRGPLASALEGPNQEADRPHRPPSQLSLGSPARHVVARGQGWRLSDAAVADHTVTPGWALQGPPPPARACPGGRLLSPDNHRSLSSLSECGPETGPTLLA